MPDSISAFEAIVRRAADFTETPSKTVSSDHPFEIRNLHTRLPLKCRLLFDDGHFSEATFEAVKYLDKVVQKLSNLQGSGSGLMMAAFGGQPPPIALTGLLTQTELDEQTGYKFIFSGTMSAIRNPKGHEFNIVDNLDTCLEQLALISLLLRRLETAGHGLL